MEEEQVIIKIKEYLLFYKKEFNFQNKTNYYMKKCYLLLIEKKLWIEINFNGNFFPPHCWRHTCIKINEKECLLMGGITGNGNINIYI